MEKKRKKAHKPVDKKIVFKTIAKYMIELLITIIGVLFGFWLNKTFGFSLQIMP